MRFAGTSPKLELYKSETMHQYLRRTAERTIPSTARLLLLRTFTPFFTNSPLVIHEVVKKNKTN